MQAFLSRTNCPNCRTKDREMFLYIQGTAWLNLKDILNDVDAHIPQEFLCHNERLTKQRFTKMAIEQAVAKFRWPFISERRGAEHIAYTKTSVDKGRLPLKLDKEPKMAEIIRFLESVFVLVDGELGPKPLCVSSRSNLGNFRPVSLEIIPYYFNMCVKESSAPRLSISLAVSRMTDQAKMLLSSVIIISVLGMVNLDDGEVEILSAPGFTMADINWVTSDQPPAFWGEGMLPTGKKGCPILHQAERFGILFYFCNEPRPIPIKYFIAEEVPTQDNNTFKAQLSQIGEGVQVVKEGNKYVASLQRDLLHYTSGLCNSVAAAEEQVAKEVCQDIAGPLPMVELFRRELKGSTYNIVSLSNNPNVSNRSVMGFVVNVPKAKWDEIEMFLGPVDSDGNNMPSHCGMNKHQGGPSVKIIRADKNCYVPRKYYYSFTGEIRFGSCSGPGCGKHVPQTYKMVVQTSEVKSFIFFYLTHHIEVRGAFNDRQQKFEEIRDKAIAREKGKEVDEDLGKVGPRLDFIGRTSPSQVRRLNLSSSDSNEDKSADDLRDAIEKERRRPENKDMYVAATPGMRSPGVILLSPVNIDPFLNFLSLHCPKAIAVSNTNRGIEVGYYEITNAAIDFSVLQRALFPVISYFMITDQELHSLASKGLLVTRGFVAPRELQPYQPSPHVPLQYVRSCGCQGLCSSTCVEFSHRQ